MKIVRSITKRYKRLRAFLSPAPAPAPVIVDSQADLKEIRSLLTYNRWFMVDQIEKMVLPQQALKCSICDYEASSSVFKPWESYCNFGGGRLLRHECPSCGVIFGPQKMFRLTPDELSNEYRMLYESYSENDTTENEIRTFHAMKPQRSGVYLNYGSGGGWNSSVTRLRAEGWNIFGFEPYTASVGEHTIRSFEQLETMRFDGIMSNNVLEHLTNPIATFNSWSRLLKGPASTMAHSTACFEYLYPITRFHLFFFTGRSMDEICRRTGFAGERAIHDGEFICYRYGVRAAGQLAA